MNSPKQRVSNKVNDLFTAMDRLSRTYERNHKSLTEGEVAKIKKAINLRLLLLMDTIDNPPTEFKLDK